MTTVLHFSDLHFAASEPRALGPKEALARAWSAIQDTLDEEAYTLVISGDVTTKGKRQGYSEALISLRDEIPSSIGIEKIVLCPGNHDISTGAEPFGPFNQFAFSLTNDWRQMWHADDPVRTVPHGELTFLLVNSAHQGDHSRGDVPLAPLERALLDATGSTLVVVLHHCPISSTYGGGGLGSAYELLELTSRYGVAAVLHGHVHSDQGLFLGRRPTLLLGVGALGFRPDPNMNNQFAALTFDKGRVVKGVLFKYYENLASFRPSEIRGLPW